MTLPDFQLDPRLVRRRAERAAAGYASVDTLAREISRRMGERLDYIRIEPRRILDLGCGPGADLVAFAERYPG
ncbi:MAG TPA: malonyl-[acyl-carrier protein] O-methyltransferase BioC, partial [Zoogloea sp.]|nr:malonyl-[acyl-carrier protein] O-methyltransferase BioC [Zoogloea sp.]